MNTDYFELFMGFVIGSLFTLGMFDIFDEYTTNYKKGQLDAMNGQVAFELKTAVDGSTQWIRIEK